MSCKKELWYGDCYFQHQSSAAWPSAFSSFHVHFIWERRKGRCKFHEKWDCPRVVHIPGTSAFNFNAPSICWQGWKYATAMVICRPISDYKQTSKSDNKKKGSNICPDNKIEASKQTSKGCTKKKCGMPVNKPSPPTSILPIFKTGLKVEIVKGFFPQFDKVFKIYIRMSICKDQCNSLQQSMPRQ